MADLARDICEPYRNVKMWSHRDSIPGRAHGVVIRAAQARGLNIVSCELLDDIAERSARAPKDDAA